MEQVPTVAYPVAIQNNMYFPCSFRSGDPCPIRLSTTSPTAMMTIRLQNKAVADRALLISINFTSG
jgi:hypothetical protein